jgi:hypothetical protein
MSGVTTGTPAYMAPEQVTGSKVGPSADRYSLATIAYEMLAGVIPFEGEGLMELLYAHVHRDPVPPSTHNRSLSPRVDAVILRGLSRDPAGRWDSCTEFVDALAAVLADKTEPVEARTVALTPGAVSTLDLAARSAPVATAEPELADRASPSATVAIPWPAPADAVAKPRSRRRLIAAVAAAALVLLLIGGAIWYSATRETVTLSLSASTVTAGESVVVTAGHVPADQYGTIQMLSAIHNFPFRADAKGNVSTEITIPRDIGAGDHTVRICWASSCHASTTLHVLEPGATTSATPGASPQPTTTPGQSPAPTGGASPRPVSSPTSAANPTPSSAPAPSPAPAPVQSITLRSVSAAGMTTATFNNFPAGTITVNVCQNGTCHQSFPFTVTPGTDTTFKTPPGILPTVLAGPAYITFNSLTSNSVTVTA